MNIRRTVVPTVLAALGLLGCDQTQPELLEQFIAAGDGSWLVRDTVEDPYEWVGDRCCNDDNPNPLPIDTIITPVIAPAGDLDWFHIRISGSFAGQLFLTAQRDNLIMRLFDSTLNVYEDVLLDTMQAAGGVVSQSGEVLWTTLYGANSAFTLLIQGDERSSEGAYELTWQRVIPVAYLTVVSPSLGNRWERGTDYRIRWSYDPADDLQGFSVYLLKGHIVIDVLKKDFPPIDELRWTPSSDLEPGSDYRIMVSLSDDPTALDISNAFALE